MAKKSDFSNPDLPLSTSDKTTPVRLRIGKGKYDSQEPETIVTKFDQIVAKHGDKPALYQKKPSSGGGRPAATWTMWTWKDYRQQCDAFAKSLISLDFSKFDTVNIIGFNSPEWFMANFGAIIAGGIPAGIYTTNLGEACRYISDHSGAKVVVCDGPKQLEKYFDISQDLQNLKALVMYGSDPIPANAKEKCSIPIYTFAEFLKLGANVPNSALKERSANMFPNEVCTLIYTSGTTGNPKAVMITHDNITWTVKTMLLRTARGTMNHNDVVISYLPLSHIAAQMLDLHAPMNTGCQVYFAQPDALKGSLGATLKEVHPTAFFGVPRVWEKIFDKMQEVAKASTGLKKKLSTWAKAKCAAHWAAQEYGNKGNVPLPFFSRLLLKKVRTALGFERCTEFYVGAAPIDTKILKYFASVNILIVDLFGQSECTGPHSLQTYKAFKFGTVGRPLPGTISKVDPDSGELYYTGRHIFAGYLGMPEETKAAIDEDGFLHSGDVVKIDSDHDPEIPKPSGFISITGRIKELIITAGGENVPPVLIENEFKRAMPALSNCMVIGDKRKFLTILLCLQVEIDLESGAASHTLTGQALETSKEIGSTAKTTDEVKNDVKWKAYFDEGLKKANDKATSRAQNVGKWALLLSDFTEKGGELTPTLKLKRSVTAKKYSAEIEALYA